jgi:hypothetical protein
MGAARICRCRPTSPIPSASAATGCRPMRSRRPSNAAAPSCPRWPSLPARPTCSTLACGAAADVLRRGAAGQGSRAARPARAGPWAILIGPRAASRRPSARASPPCPSMSIPQSGGGPIERPANSWPSISPRAASRNRGLAHRHRAREVRLLQGHAAPLPYDGPRSIRAMLEGLRDRFGWAPGRGGGQHHRAGEGRRERQPRARRAAGAVGRAAPDHPRDLRRGERAPARGEVGRRRHRRGLHRPRRGAALDATRRCR